MVGFLNRTLDVGDYLIFHLISEFGSIVVSFAIFVIGWYGYKQRANPRSLTLALGFFAVGVLDFAHALSFQGMPAFFSENSVSKAATFWVAARLIAALVLLAVAFVPARTPPAWLRPWALLAATATAVAAFIALETARPELLPAMFVDREGLTATKNGLEYLVIAIQLGGLAALWHKPFFDFQATTYLLAALVVSVFSELAFTLYASAFDSYNFLGHLYKVGAYYLILQAIFVTSLRQPYLELNRAREHLEHSFQSVGAALSSSLELNKTLKLIAELASDMLHSPCALVALRQEEGEENLMVLATRGLRTAPAVLPLQNSLAAKVWHSGEAVWVDDLAATPVLFCPEIAQGRIRAAISAPITKDKNILGVIQVYSRKPKSFNEAEANLLTAFARHAAVAIENARIYENQIISRAKIQRYATQLSILHNIGLSLNKETDKTKLMKMVLDDAAELTSAGFGAMTLVEDGKPHLVSVYYAPWQQERCNTETFDICLGEINLHRRVTKLLGGDRDVARIALEDVRPPLKFPYGHLTVRGLLVGAIKDMRGQIRGHFMLSDKAGGGDFTAEDEEIISLLAAQSSVALMSAENLEREHYVAETLQTALLPAAPVRQDVEVGLLYRSAGPFGKIGGDFYDFIELEDGKIAVVVGDVCGKGLEAATYTAMIKYMLRAYLEEGMYPGDCLTKLNRIINKQVSLEKFITIGIAVISTARGTITYSSAGHPPPMLCREGQAHPLYTPSAVPLGVLPDFKYLSSQIALMDTCSILMYTDGLIEARPEDGEPFGRRLVPALAERCCLPAQQLVGKLLEIAIEYSGGFLRDDIALLAVRINQGQSGPRDPA